MKMDVFCTDIADSLDTDARIQNMKTLRNWNKDWQQLSKGVGSRGDAVLEERLNSLTTNGAHMRNCFIMSFVIT
jgi:hypothetical protein